MDEREWLTCADPEAMIRFLEGKATGRKWRLVAFACVQRVVTERRLQAEIGSREPRWKAIIKLVEEFIEGHASRVDLAGMHESCRLGVLSFLTEPPSVAGSYMAWRTSVEAAFVSSWTIPNYETGPQPNRFYRARTEAPRERRKATERRAQCDLFRCVFGHLFWQDSILDDTVLDPAILQWNDGTVRRIAQAIYDQRAFDHMPILADALEDAGCDNADILNHCRNGGEHVRGCWVIDLLLGKS